MTGGAAAQVESPAWLAVMEQVPPAIGVTLMPRTVQIVLLFEANVTARLEVAVALNAAGPLPATSSLSGLKVMVCVSSTVNVWVTDGASAIHGIAGLARRDGAGSGGHQRHFG